jgi:ABC-type branched-subunit amino acid transport system ATPase component
MIFFKTANSVMIDIKNLIKDFSGLKAIDSLCHKVPENEIFGLIGMDGSVKNILRYMFAGITDLTAGNILCKDKNITRNTREIKSFFGYGYKNIRQCRVYAKKNQTKEESATTVYEITIRIE